MRGALHAGVAHSDGGHQGEPERQTLNPKTLLGGITTGVPA